MTTITTVKLSIIHNNKIKIYLFFLPFSEWQLFITMSTNLFFVAFFFFVWIIKFSISLFTTFFFFFCSCFDAPLFEWLQRNIFRVQLNFSQLHYTFFRNYWRTCLICSHDLFFFRLTPTLIAKCIQQARSLWYS
jgi:hypothetical protein